MLRAHFAALAAAVIGLSSVPAFAGSRALDILELSGSDRFGVFDRFVSLGPDRVGPRVIGLSLAGNPDVALGEFVQVERLAALEQLRGLDRLDRISHRLEKLHRFELGRLTKFDGRNRKLDRFERPGNIQRFHRLDHRDKLGRLDRSKNLADLRRFEKTGRFERTRELDRIGRLDRPRRLSRFDRIREQRLARWRRLEPFGRSRWITGFDAKGRASLFERPLIPGFAPRKIHVRRFRIRRR